MYIVLLSTQSYLPFWFTRFSFFSSTVHKTTLDW